MRQVQALWLCHRIDGCRLDFHAEKPLVPLTLGQFVGRPNVRVRLKCRGDRCKFHRLWRVEEMIAGLEKRGQGSSGTEVDGLGAKMTTACPRVQAGELGRGDPLGEHRQLWGGRRVASDRLNRERPSDVHPVSTTPRHVHGSGRVPRQDRPPNSWGDPAPIGRGESNQWNRPTVGRKLDLGPSRAFPLRHVPHSATARVPAASNMGS